MQLPQIYYDIVAQKIGNNFVIDSLADADNLHKRCIAARVELINHGLFLMMPHYRGEQNAGWNILNGMSRTPLSIKDPAAIKQLERKVIDEFETAVTNTVAADALRDLFHKEKYGREWDLLFQAQHAGVKTSLTDWSPEAISALYFATEESTDQTIENSDGQFWCLLTPEDWIVGHNTIPVRNSYYDLDPFNLDFLIMVNSPSYLDNINTRLYEMRMYRQKGRFLIMAKNDCHTAINENAALKPFLLRYIIPADSKQKIRDELAARGVIRQNMYIDESVKGKDLVTHVNHAVFGI